MPLLIAVSVAFGVLALLVFRRFSRPERVRDARRSIWAHLYELRLFTDEPALVWKAQLALLRDNLRYAVSMLLPVLVLAVPGFVLFQQLDAIFGHAPLPAGTAAVVTARLRQPIDVNVASPKLDSPDGIAVETPGVRVPADREISWRVRPLRAGAGELRLELRDGVVAKHIQAGIGLRYLSERRVRSWTDFLWQPTETRLSSPDVDWIEVRYPRATIRWLGWNVSWVVWFLLLSGITVLALRRRFGVTF